MALIDVTYFVDEINIPNTGQATISSRLVRFIDKYETKFLDIVLGYPLSQQFVTGYAELPPAQKWKDLAEGATYTRNGHEKKWQGLLKISKKESCIALYVYYWYARDSHTKTTSAGEVKNKTENADQITPAWKMSRAWAELKEWVCDLYDFLEVNKDTYLQQKSVYQVLCELGFVNEFGL